MTPSLAGHWQLYLVGAGCYGLLGGALDLALLTGAAFVQTRSASPGYLASPLPWLDVGLLAVAALVYFGARSATPTWPTAAAPDGLAREAPGKVLFFPCKTTHTRMTPKKHFFAYSYLVVGFPVSSAGLTGRMVSTGPEATRRAWFHIEAEDYLERGNGHLGLRGKLDTYLASQGVDPARYPHAYLVTAPRFLGYQFNPVSFWYLYDADRTLAAMVLEVNNTFGERRLYFLASDAASPGSGDQASDDDGHRPPVFARSWPKDFHVSPFNSRKGSYSLKATDPLAPGMQGAGAVNTTIVLRSSKEHGKIVARLFSDGPTVDPAQLSALQMLRFFAPWAWVGFVTLPRILKEAGALFFKRGLHIWFRPEPLKQSMARLADGAEQRIERVFRNYLRHVVERSKAAVAVNYIPAGIIPGQAELMLSPATRNAPGAVEEMELRVLTPAFYSRFVGYAHDMEAFFAEFRQNDTIYVSHPETLSRLVLTEEPAPALRVSNILDFAAFKAIQLLRRVPDRIERPKIWPIPPETAADTDAKCSAADIRRFRISPMDGYVLAHEDSRARSAYRRAVLKLFIADQVAFGMVPLLDASCVVLRVWLAWTLSRDASWMVRQAGAYIRAAAAP